MLTLACRLLRSCHLIGAVYVSRLTGSSAADSSGVASEIDVACNQLR
jgi:hypothetical protein